MRGNDCFETKHQLSVHAFIEHGVRPTLRSVITGAVCEACLERFSSRPLLHNHVTNRSPQCKTCFGRRAASNGSDLPKVLPSPPHQCTDLATLFANLKSSILKKYGGGQSAPVYFPRKYTGQVYWPHVCRYTSMNLDGHSSFLAVSVLFIRECPWSVRRVSVECLSSVWL